MTTNGHSSSRQRKRANPATAMGVLAILLAILMAPLWGFGFDRFGILAAAAGVAGVALTSVGAVIDRKGDRHA